MGLILFLERSLLLQNNDLGKWTIVNTCLLVTFTNGDGNIETGFRPVEDTRISGLAFNGKYVGRCMILTDGTITVNHVHTDGGVLFNGQEWINMSGIFKSV